MRGRCVRFIAARANDAGITFVAFTATPKKKTIELFGTRPDPTKPTGPGNIPAPFHVYYMRQAIEEEFILDVLKNYTPYKLAFKLAHEGRDYDERTVERAAAMKGIIHEPSTKPTMKPESQDALLTAIAKARGWIDDQS